MRSVDNTVCLLTKYCFLVWSLWT